MAVIINQCADEIYVGHLKLGGSTAVKPGVMLIPDYSDGNAVIPADDATADASGEMAMVCNYDSYADTDLTSSKDFTVDAGEYLRLKTLKKGDIFTTDQFAGTYATIAVDDIFTVAGGTGGFEAIAARTPVLKVKVIEKTTLYGNDALKFRVIAA